MYSDHGSNRTTEIIYRLIVLALDFFLGSLSKSTYRGKTIILQENVSKFMDIDIASSNITNENPISIRCNNITLYVCRKDDVCSKKTKSNIFNVTKIKDGILRVYFENVVGSSPIVINGTWQVCNVGEIGNTCDETLTRHVFIYAQLDYFNCSYEFVGVDHNLTVSCNVKNISPQAICSFETENVLSNIQYDYSQDSQNITKCSVTLNFNKEFYQVKTIMYPNMTGDITDMAYGINVTLYVMNVGRFNLSKKCFVEGNSTSIYSFSCEERQLENVTTDSNTETAAFSFEITLNKKNSETVYCNKTTKLSETTTWSKNNPDISSSQSSTSSIDLNGTSLSSQPPFDFNQTKQGSALLMTTSLTIISIIVFTILTMILLYRFVSYPKHLMTVGITKSYICLTKNTKGDEIDNTDIYHLFNKTTCENDHYTTIDELKKEKERQSSETFYRPAELTQNGDFHALNNLRNAECSMKLEKNGDLDNYEKI